MDYQFCLYPTTNAMRTANPIWQGQQAASMVCQPTKTSFDVITAMIERFSELFHNIHQSLDFRRSQPTTHGGLRRQFFSQPEVHRPIFQLAGPRGRPFVQRGPKENHHDLEVKESGRASRVPSYQTFCRIGIMPTRVRVPCLISLKKGFNKISMDANSPIFPAPPQPMLASA